MHITLLFGQMSSSIHNTNKLASHFTGKGASVICQTPQNKFILRSTFKISITPQTYKIQINFQLCLHSQLEHSKAKSSID